MTYRRWFSATLLCLHLACTGGGIRNEPSDVGSEAPRYKADSPPSPAAPSNGYGPTPTASEQPGYNSDAPLRPGAPAAEPRCTAICDAQLEAGCNIVSRDACIAECSGELGEQEGACFDELLELLLCLVGQPEFSCPAGEPMLGDYARLCPTAALAYAACTEPPPEPCSLGDSCAGCEGACEACLCRSKNDFEACSDVCG